MVLSKNGTTVHHFESGISGIILLSLPEMLGHACWSGNGNGQTLVFDFRPENAGFILHGQLGLAG